MIGEMEKRGLERDFVARAPKHPIKLAEFEEASLPDPGRWRWCVVAVTDVGCVAVSNGVAWVRSDGSAL
ncbi:MAG: hypothetical protein JNK30_21955 [Phenylobacterium sp.]|uniref:hypothetical protein n=1 Tax=Phenylobacterium sp. TaxID=1871053 RepID=UPI001A45A3F9|nr:hypothetical protein [Phenylobacterium sp.]MBL8774067.1 hypothetical protein [Phenylobacterium sp.]